MADHVDTAPKLARQCDITRRRNAEKRKARVCEQCGNPFQQGDLSRAQREAGHVQRYCSNSCRAASTRRYGSKREAKTAEYRRARERKGVEPLPSVALCERCSTPFKPSQLVQRRCPLCSASGSKAAARYPCVCCGKVFNYEKTGGRPCVTCSECCAKEMRNAHRRIAKLRRRDRLRVPGSQTVVATQVFDRDGWRCRQCGIETPLLLRGTSEPNAPELDHIVPLSRGGLHSYANTQCLCRACNGIKGAKLA